MASLQNRLEPVDAAKERSKGREVIIRETAKAKDCPIPLVLKERNFKSG